MKNTIPNTPENEKVSVITETMKIVGDVQSDCMILLEGSIKGNVKTDENFESYIDSKVEGNIKARSAMLGGELIGNASCDETITVDVNTRVNGNLEADTITIAGLVQGDVHAKEVLQLKASAHVYGQITCALVSIEEGAMIEGSFKMVKKEKARTELVDEVEEISI